MRDADEKVVDFVYAETARQGKARIAKEVVLKNGVDLYFSSQHFLQSLGKLLKQRFCGELIVTSRLFSTQKHTSKELHRVTVMFRQLPFCVGDTIEHDSTRFKVLAVTKQVQLQDLSSGKKKMIPIATVERYRKV